MEENTQDLRNKFNDIDSKFDAAHPLERLKKLMKENEELSDQITDFRCWSTKYNLIFTGINDNDH